MLCLMEWSEAFDSFKKETYQVLSTCVTVQSTASATTFTTLEDAIYVNMPCENIESAKLRRRRLSLLSIWQRVGQSEGYFVPMVLRIC